MLIDSYAKINLFLDVLNKRPDGYHEIDTLYSTIDLHDSLKFVLTKKPQINFLTNIPKLASNENLVFRITQRIFDTYGVDCGVEIYLEKHIPVAAGLGGGSSNAAMTILALDSLLKLNMSQRVILNLAAEYGSDISFFLYGGFARGVGRGEKITPMPDIEPMQLLLLNPGISVASSEAYKLIDWDYQSSGKKLWFNKLENGVVKKYPLIGQIIAELKQKGATESIMSGSGSTCIGLFAKDNVLKDAECFFKQKKYWTKVVRTIDSRSYKKCIQNLS